MCAMINGALIPSVDRLLNQFQFQGGFDPYMIFLVEILC
jgi:hypothetical protein